VLEVFARQGYALPDTPMMAFHRGDVTRLKNFLRRDRLLSERRFSCLEIYPPDGTTLLHLAIDFDEKEVFDLLLAHGADVNARANVDAEGFGGHTPIYNAVVSHGKRQASMARRLLERGAPITVRASLRKFLDWCETPRWHKALDVTPAEWGRTFPEKGWVNEEALRLLEPAVGESST